MFSYAHPTCRMVDRKGKEHSAGFPNDVSTKQMFHKFQTTCLFSIQNPLFSEYWHKMIRTIVVTQIRHRQLDHSNMQAGNFTLVCDDHAPYIFYAMQNWKKQGIETWPLELWYYQLLQRTSHSLWQVSVTCYKEVTLIKSLNMEVLSHRKPATAQASNSSCHTGG